MSQSSFGGSKENLRQPSSIGRFSSQVKIDQSRFVFSRHSSFKCLSQKQSVEKESEKIKREEQQVYEFERLFSNLNQVTLKRESGAFLTILKLGF